MIRVISVIAVVFAVIIAYYFTREQAPRPTENLNQTYDYIIVGAGSSGAVLASRLSEDPDVSVLVLEAGDTGEDSWLISIPFTAALLKYSEVDWQYLTVPQRHSQFSMQEHRSAWPRGKVLGGSSSINMMVAVRGNRHDYDSWAEEGCTGWSYRDILPYFLKSEDIQIKELNDSPYHGHGGPLVITNGSATPMEELYIKAGEEMGYSRVDCNGEDQIGFCNLQSTVNKGERWSTYRAFLRPAMKRKNLHVGVKSLVTKIVIENKRAVGVEVIRNNRKETIYATKEVLLSAGSINSPQILMLSGIGPKKHLEDFGIDVIQDLPVGENLQDHPCVVLVFYTNNTAPITRRKMMSFSTFWDYFFYKTGYMSSTGLEGIAFFYSDDAISDKGKSADIQLHFQSVHVFEQSNKDDVAQTFPFKKELMDILFPDDGFSTAFLLLPQVLHPKSKGTIRLKSTDPFDHPEIDPHYLEHEEDMNILLKGIQRVKTYLETSTMRQIGIEFDNETPLTKVCKEHTFNTEKFWDCYIRHFTFTTFHPTSTCRMGDKSDKTAVVDPNLRVKGINGLRVVDASVMRNVPSGNTNLPSIMIGEKAADLIRGIDSVKHIRKKLEKY